MSDDGRITINRRVFRTGESEFRLNGKRVRLKDISDILMDTGLGIRNYSVMEQGKIDLILSNKPQDRRKPDRGSGRHHEVQDEAPRRGAEAGRDAAEPAAHRRHARPRSRAI